MQNLQKLVKSFQQTYKNITSKNINKIKIDLTKINRFARKKLTEEDVYIFSVILCDNDIDRDMEAFTKAALFKMADLFIGVTGIRDHDASTKNQCARIYETEVIETKEKTKTGEPKYILKANAYILKNEANENIISDIEGGIKKEVSVCCKIEKKICSICGATYDGSCSHTLGKHYGKKYCYIKLDEPSDAYEWSFVAVPSQRGAGVIKNFNMPLKNYEKEKHEKIGLYYENKLKADVIKLSLLNNFMPENKTFKDIIDKLSIKELEALKEEFSKNIDNVLAFSTNTNRFKQKKFKKNDEKDFII